MDDLDIPESMKAELSAWNNGKGIDLESWVGCEGNFRLAVGYTTIFWPAFVEFEGYILRDSFSVDSLRAFEARANTDKASIESVMNHLHLDDIQYLGCPDITIDKLIFLGSILKEIYEAKLKFRFPDRPCRVSLFIPDDKTALSAYEITFWQIANESARREGR